MALSIFEKDQSVTFLSHTRPPRIIQQQGIISITFWNATSLSILTILGSSLTDVTHFLNLATTVLTIFIWSSRSSRFGKNIVCWFDPAENIKSSTASSSLSESHIAHPFQLCRRCRLIACNGDRVLHFPLGFTAVDRATHEATGRLLQTVAGIANIPG